MNEITRFKKYLALDNIRDPYRCLSLAVIQLAFADGTVYGGFEWLTGRNDTLKLFRDGAGITPGGLRKAIEHWFPP